MARARSLVIGVVANGIAVVIGRSSALQPAYFRGWLTPVLMRFTDPDDGLSGAPPCNRSGRIFTPSLWIVAWSSRW